MATKTTTTKTTDERNGVRRPIRGIALEIWTALDASGGPKAAPSFRSLADVAGMLGVNARTLAQQVWRYRRFHDIAK